MLWLKRIQISTSTRQLQGEPVPSVSARTCFGAPVSRSKRRRQCPENSWTQSSVGTCRKTSWNHYVLQSLAPRSSDMPTNAKEFALWIVCIIPSCVVCYQSCSYERPPERPAIELPPMIVTASPASEKQS